MKQTTLRTKTIRHSNNISFPIGTTLCVRKYGIKLDFNRLFGKYKTRGISLPHLVEALITYRLTENQSTVRGYEWISRKEVREEFSLPSFEQRTLFRVHEILGDNREEVMYDFQDILFSLYDFPHTDINLDWTSFVLWGGSCPIGEYGYSRDHRPDKKQITVGIAELREPINIPYALTIQPGNIVDQTHFKTTFEQAKRKLKNKSLIIFDKGANSKDNISDVLASKMKYLTAKKLNTSDDKVINDFWNRNPSEVVEGTYGFVQAFPSRYNYFFFSEKLREQQTMSKIRKAERLLAEAKDIQKSIDHDKQLPRRFRINNPLVRISYSYQTRLKNMSEEEALELVKKAAINGREGFFCLTSSHKLTLKQALMTYRKKDSIEKVIQSLKNDINIRPLRVWSNNSMYGAVLIGFFAQVILSLIRYDYAELKNTAPKFIKISLMNLTVTVEKEESRPKRWIYANFDPINELILLQKQGVT